MLVHRTKSSHWQGSQRDGVCIGGVQRGGGNLRARHTDVHVLPARELARLLA